LTLTRFPVLEKEESDNMEAITEAATIERITVRGEKPGDLAAFVRGLSSQPNIDWTEPGRNVASDSEF